jgi:hypothetical protein
MKNANIGAPISDQDMKGIIGGYEAPTFCWVDCDPLEAYACCNSGRCKCVANLEQAYCQSGGSNASFCSSFQGTAFTTLEQP